MTVHNAGRFLRRALESILAQDYRSIEVIVCDNASTDGSSDVCREYAAADDRIRYYRNPTNLGPMRNSLKAVDLCSGEFMLCAADHDVYHPRFISTLLDFMLRDTELVVAYPRTVLIDENDQVMALVDDRLDTRGMDACRRFSKIIWEFTWGNLGYGLHRSAALKKVADIHKTIGPDHLIFAKISLIGTIGQVDQPLFFRRENRPGETPERQVRRQTSWFVRATSRTLIPWTTLAYEHLKVVRESDLSSQEKGVLIDDVRRCFTSRFGRNMRQEASELMGHCERLILDPAAPWALRRDRCTELAELVEICRFFYPDLVELDQFEALKRKILQP